MADKPQARSTQFSRRMLLRRAVRAAGAAAILGLTANRAAAKISQAAVAYQPQPNGDSASSGTVDMNRFLPVSRDTMD